MKKKGVKDEIVLFYHCAKCIKELPEGKSPQDFSRLEVGYTKRGIQVWCIRHNINVINIDLTIK